MRVRISIAALTAIQFLLLILHLLLLLDGCDGINVSIVKNIVRVGHTEGGLDRGFAGVVRGLFAGGDPSCGIPHSVRGLDGCLRLGEFVDFCDFGGNSGARNSRTEPAVRKALLGFPRVLAPSMRDAIQQHRIRHLLFVAGVRFVQWCARMKSSIKAKVGAIAIRM